MCSNIEYHITDEELHYFEIVSLDYKEMLDSENSEDAIKIDNTSLIANYYASPKSVTVDDTVYYITSLRDNLFKPLIFTAP